MHCLYGMKWSRLVGGIGHMKIINGFLMTVLAVVIQGVPKLMRKIFGAFRGSCRRSNIEFWNWFYRVGTWKVCVCLFWDYNWLITFLWSRRWTGPHGQGQFLQGCKFLYKNDLPRLLSEKRYPLFEFDRMSRLGHIFHFMNTLENDYLH